MSSIMDNSSAILVAAEYAIILDYYFESQYMQTNYMQTNR